jgi:hypothetical protein
MGLKRHLNPDQKFGLTEEEIKVSEKYLRRHKTAGAVNDSESSKLYELLMIGYSFSDIHQQYPQYPMGQIILTAALRGWCKDRDRMMGTLRDRIQARVAKSVIEQVDFLTTMLSVTNVQHMDAMRKYILDPINNPLPKLTIGDIKEYKEVAETLSKLVSSVSPGGKKSAMMDAISAQPTTNKIEKTVNKQQVKVLDIRQLDMANEDDE